MALCEPSADEGGPIKCTELLHGGLYRCGHKLVRIGAVVGTVYSGTWGIDVFRGKSVNVQFCTLAYSVAQSLPGAKMETIYSH